MERSTIVSAFRAGREEGGRYGQAADSLGTAVDAKGAFEFRARAPGLHIPIRALGYRQRLVQVSLGAGTHLSRDEIDRLGALHFTQILQRVPGFRVAWNPPGSQQPTTVKITRCAEANPPKVALYVDGIRRRSSSSELSQGYGLRISDGRGRRQSGGEYAVEQFAELLDSVNPRDIELVEVYRGVSQIPADFDRDVRAVIAIWTRWNQG